MSSAVESPRDMEESAFTEILRALLRSMPGMLAVAFVDDEGECIDYCSRLPAFDAKIYAAHFVVIANTVKWTLGTRQGEPWSIYLACDDKDVLVRRVSDDYTLVVVTRADDDPSRLTEAVEAAVRDLRREGGVRTPAWEPASRGVRVEVRRSTSQWSYAPRAFWENGQRVLVADVLGRFVERDGEQSLVCFLVRTDSGEELTLVHRLDQDRWERR